jgi:branched-chain amino acid transport system substrate-binding protein
MTDNPTISRWRGGVCGLLLVVATAAIAGCASSGSGIQPGETLTVYVSMPLRGPQAPAGRDVVDGARMALGDAGRRVGNLRIRAVYMDDTAGGAERARWSPAAAAANARRASEDSAAIAYIGDFESGATRFSLPITNEAHILQVSPASAAVDLAQPFLGAGDQVPEEVQPTGERTFGRVIPSDETQARAGAVWAKRLKPNETMVIRGETRYDDVMASAFRDEATSIGVRITKSGPGPEVSDLAYAAVEPSDRGPLSVVRVTPRVIGTDALLAPTTPRLTGARPGRRLITAAAQAPEQLPREGQRFIRDFRERYDREPGPYAAYGYEAMAVVLDSIARAGESGDDRDAVVDAFLETTDRTSVLGTYSIDEAGNTTLGRLSGYRVEGGRPVLATPLTVSR